MPPTPRRRPRTAPAPDGPPQRRGTFRAHPRGFGFVDLAEPWPGPRGEQVGSCFVPPPMTAPHAAVPGATSGGALVQLGAFPTEAKANQAWSGYAKRFGYLATLGKVVEPAKVGERTVYRLRVNAGGSGAAADVCGRLKIAGEDCFVTAG